MLIWTRSLEDWPKDKKILEISQKDYLHVPCVQTKPLNFNFKSQSENSLIIFTSPRAVIYSLLNADFEKILSSAYILCFGESSANVLQSRGYASEVFDSIESASEIPAQLLKKNISKDKTIFLPGPRQRAFDLYESLSKMGFKVYSFDVYETISQLKFYDVISETYKRPNEDEKKKFILEWRGSVFLGSPSACKGFVEALEPQNNALRKNLTAFVLGPTTFAVCKDYFERVERIKSLSDYPISKNA